MRVNRTHILILLLGFCGSCIEPFNPLIDKSQEVLVINGFITDRSGPHRVVISRTTPFNDPSHQPVAGCVVAVLDETGLMIEYTEISAGLYEANLDTDFLQVGKSYALYVSTPDGNVYRSDYDQMHACAPVDSIYYEVQSKGTTDPNVTIDGIQFFLDVKGSEETAANYRWLLEETWKYTAPHYASHIWDGEQLREYTANYYCHMTDTVKGFFSASTQHLSVNSLNRAPIHYVSNETPRLVFKYSILVEQHSLSDQAYDFWVRMGAQSNEGIGLYESQPASTLGNIYNVNDPSERVLGFFYATQIRNKRLTFHNQFDFYVAGFPECNLDTIQNPSELGDDLPYYLASIDPTGFGGPPYLVGPKKCFDCTLFGGTTEEPDF